MKYLRSVVEFWIRQKALCRKAKQKQFGETAATLWNFMGKSFNELYIDTKNDQFRFAGPEADEGPYYKPRLNKTREFVNVVLPFVHAKIPHRLATSRRPPLPDELAQMLGVAPGPTPDEQISSWLIQWWLNYLPGMYGAKREQRTTITECLAKGRGVGWHEMIEGPTGYIPGTFYDTVDFLDIDHSCRQWREAGFIIREHHWPSWRLAERFQIDARKIEGAQKTAQDRQVEEDSYSGVVGSEESDDCTWFEVWSRVGFGQHYRLAADELKDKATMLDEAGRHIWLPILPGLDYPLSLPPEIWDVATEAELKGRTAWPIAFFADPANPFPCTPMDIYPGTDSPWPTAPLEGVIPLQVFLDHLYAFLMGRIRATSRDIILTAKSLEDSVTKAIESGRDQIVVACEGLPGDEVQKLIHILQFPETNKDSWRLVLQVERAFEQGSGMDPLLYGGEGNRQIRSAEEAGVRQANVTNRPNDYADAVEEWNSQCAAKEAQMSRLHVTPQCVAPLFGELVTEDESQYGPLSLAWGAVVNTDEPTEACADLVLVEAGSGRRKNRQKQMQDFQAISQTLVPVLQTFASEGVTGPWNNYVEMAEEVFEVPLGRLKLPEMMPPTAEDQGREEETTGREEDSDVKQQELDIKREEVAIKRQEAETREKQAAQQGTK